MKPIALTCLLLLLSFAVLCQDAPKAELIDEFGPIPCDDFLARMDISAGFLDRNPGSRLLISIAGSGISTDWRWVLLREGMMKSYLQEHKGVESSRITFVRLKPSDKLTVAVWSVPLEGAYPEFETHDYDLRFLPREKAFVWFYSGSKYPYHICPEWNGFATYIELLTANPTARAHVVIATTSPEAFEKKKVEVAEKLAGIEPSRIRYFFEKYDEYPGFEFWIVPGKAEKDK